MILFQTNLLFVKKKLINDFTDWTFYFTTHNKFVLNFSLPKSSLIEQLVYCWFCFSCLFKPMHLNSLIVKHCKIPNRWWFVQLILNLLILNKSVQALENCVFNAFYLSICMRPFYAQLNTSLVNISLGFSKRNKKTTKSSIMIRRTRAQRQARIFQFDSLKVITNFKFSLNFHIFT